MTITIDGSRIKDLESLYDEIQLRLCPDFEGFGRNYNAVIDVLEGGFGVHEYEEPLHLIWNDSDSTRHYLKKDFDDLVDYIKEMNHIQFEMR